MDADGDGVVVWVSDAQDGSGRSVHAQRFATDGSPAGAEFQVNLSTANDQMNASVAMDADGDFVVSWSSLEQDGSDRESTPGGSTRRDVPGVANSASTKPRRRINDSLRWRPRPCRATSWSSGGSVPCRASPASRKSWVQIRCGRRPPERRISNGMCRRRISSRNRTSRSTVRGDYAVIWLRRQAAGTDDVAPHFRRRRHADQRRVSRPSIQRRSTDPSWRRDQCHGSGGDVAQSDHGGRRHGTAARIHVPFAMNGRTTQRRYAREQLAGARTPQSDGRNDARRRFCHRLGR